MRIALVRPAMPYIVSPGAYGPIGLGYLSSYLKKKLPGIEVDLVDMACGDTLEDGYDVYGWTSTSLDFHTVMELAIGVRERNPDAKQIIGGSHVTARPSSAALSLFDAIFLGEAEESLYHWLSLEYDCPWAARERVSIPVQDLDTLPFPDRRRPEAKQLVGGHAKSVTILTSRGCPYKCAFCATQVMFEGYRYRSAENVLAEVRHVKDTLGVTDIAFIDDNLLTPPGRFWRILHGLQEMQVSYRCLARVNQVTREVLSMMHRSGCTEVCFGIESFDQDVLDALHKGIRESEAAYAIRMAHESGLNVRVFMLISTPGETEYTADINIEALETLRDYYDLVTLSTLMPLPGTPVCERPEEHGVKIIDHDYSKHNRYQWAPGGETPLWSPLEIEGLPRGIQLDNIRKMRDYIGSIPQGNKGVPGKGK